MSITLSDAIMDELNREALQRTDKFISDGLEVAQKAIEFRREVSFTHGCIDSACTHAAALELPNTSRRVVVLREDTRQIKDQSNEWLVKATRLVKKLDGAGRPGCLCCPEQCPVLRQGQGRHPPPVPRRGPALPWFRAGWRWSRLCRSLQDISLPHGQVLRGVRPYCWSRRRSGPGPPRQHG